MASVGPFAQVHYPESDGKPMGETDEHRDAMVRHIQILQEYYREQQVYVSGDLLVYYEEGDPSKYVVPNAFVIKGVSPNRRRTYKIWLEGKGPDVVIETTSCKTRRKDTTTKPELYARLGVKEVLLVRSGSGISGSPSSGLSHSRSSVCAAETRPRRRSDESGTGTAAATGRGGSAILSLGYRRTAPDPGRSPTGR